MKRRRRTDRAPGALWTCRGPTRPVDARRIGRIRAGWSRSDTGGAAGPLYVARVVPVDAWEGVRPGFSCSAEITTASRRKVVAAPKLALLSRDGQLGVWIARAGRISFRAVELGIDGEAYVEVLAGLRVGDRVVTGPADVARWLVPSITVRERERWVGPTARRSFSNARGAAVESLAREGLGHADDGVWRKRSHSMPRRTTTTRWLVVRNGMPRPRTVT